MPTQVGRVIGRLSELNPRRVRLDEERTPGRWRDSDTFPDIAHQMQHTVGTKLAITPKYIQVDCLESDALDTRQAEAVKAYRPDIVILEYPNNHELPGFELNQFEPQDKPKHLVAERMKPLSDAVLAIHPWARADQIMWQNIAKLWSEGHQVLVYPVDGPSELTSEWFEVWNHMYPQATQNWVWWVQIYLRERLMANNVRYVLEAYTAKPDPTILIFLEEFHWDHVQFLLTNPTSDEIWAYYFGKFSHEITRDQITTKIQKLNPVFYRYWQQYSDFCD